MNASHHVIELVRQRLAGEHQIKVSDREIARVLNLSRAAISAYKAGKDVMSPVTLERAQDILKLHYSELAELSLMLSMQATPEQSAVFRAQQWMLEHAKRFGELAGEARKPVTGIVLAFTMATSGSFFPANSDASTPKSLSEQDFTAYTLCALRRRRARRPSQFLRRFFATVFPAIDLAALLGRCTNAYA